ncbi:DUF4129 domain-containing protein [Haloarchaeobius sp. HRN-SO-5]|uniref:DUF4129 domain-containing protein n=1 Tax=Haloarchaeobius sp. HRN-SO-5 TaxID=3446118 RepID=UPI003EBF2740
MNRRTLGVLVVALCCVGAIVLAAGTLSETANPGEEASGPASRPDDGSTTTQTSTPMDADHEGGQNDVNPPVSSSRCESSLPPAVVLGLVGVVAVTTAGMYRRYDGLVAVTSFFVVFVVVASVVPFLVACPTQPVDEDQQNGSWAALPNQSEDVAGGSGDGTGQPGESSPEIPTPLVLLGGIVAIAAVVVGGVWVVRREDDDGDFEVVDAPDEPDEEPAESADVAGVAAAAGRAADRIEAEQDLDNEICRAWVEMTTYLPVDHPETSTPREFEHAAVEAGIAPADVRDLTDLFERVRYGHEDVTADDERRAVEALRRVEAQDGGENG